MSHTGLMQESVETLLKQDRDCLWHHLTQHKVFQTSEPLVMVEGIPGIGYDEGRAGLLRHGRCHQAQAQGHCRSLATGKNGDQNSKTTLPGQSFHGGKWPGGLRFGESGAAHGPVAKHTMGRVAASIVAIRN